MKTNPDNATYNILRYGDDDDDELFLWYGWSMKGV